VSLALGVIRFNLALAGRAESPVGVEDSIVCRVYAYARVADVVGLAGGGERDKGMVTVEIEGRGGVEHADEPVKVYGVSNGDGGREGYGEKEESD
jgi:hypothetical protein